MPLQLYLAVQNDLECSWDPQMPQKVIGHHSQISNLTKMAKKAPKIVANTKKKTAPNSFQENTVALESVQEDAVPTQSTIHNSQFAVCISHMTLCLKLSATRIP